MNTLTAPEPQVSQPSEPRRTRLGRYADPESGEARELATVRGAGGSTLVIDRLAWTHADARLIAHLAADEPPENAHVVCEMYLADETRGRCRRVTSQDLELHPPILSRPATRAAPPPLDTPLLDANGDSYRIRAVSDGEPCRALRWTRTRHGREEDFAVLTLRDVVGALEDYEPARALTINALAAPGGEDCPSVYRLRTELERLDESPTLLNRGLREAVQRTLARGETSLSEIALRCGRVKRDRRGNVSGETSWLARRIGLMPEGGETEPTPWIHSDVLALIIREGLCGSPHEIELG
ncbi:MAG TPA: hypothetical protein VES97_07995 [Solirubrobacteraceae bacterium]|nr:hypothetical protein [Solirubrobacteraceae bacterium]